jgi:PAS domain S-box-containing protein
MLPTFFCTLGLFGRVNKSIKQDPGDMDKYARLPGKGRSVKPGLPGDALKESEDRYHKMIEEVEDYAILMLDREGLIQNWNKGAEKIKGYKEEEVIGQHFRIFYPPKDQAEQLPEKLIALAIKEGKAVHEGWRVRKDGTQFWGSIVITALHNEDNSIVAFSKVTRDLTERKLAEDKLLSYTRQLESQNSQLQQFAYAAAHDMKEPLRKIQLYISAVISDTDSTLSADRKLAYLKSSADAAHRMQGLIEDLLAFAKVSEQSQTFDTVDLNELWQEAVSFYHDTTQEFSASVTSGSLPVVKGISFQLKQLLLNLVGNSLKYRHPDRLPEIKISSATVFQSYAGRDKYPEQAFYKISIQDNGIGFHPKFADKIFEMFERLHTREIYAGTGIGLAICKKIVENHGGKITADGREQEGARFDIYLPAS